MILDTNKFTDDDQAAVLAAGLIRYTAWIHELSVKNPAAIPPIYQAIENAREQLGVVSGAVSPVMKAFHKGDLIWR